MNWTTERLRQFADRPVAIDDDATKTYAHLLHDIACWQQTLDTWGIGPGERVALIADYHIEVVALLQALTDRGCIVIPLADEDRALLEERLYTACATRVITVAQPHAALETAQCRTLPADDAPLHPLLAPLVAAQRPGFIIFTSGSTGKGKAVLLDYERMTRKYCTKVRPAFRTLLFLKLDHIGGLNTLFSVIFNGGVIVTCASRQVKAICACVERNAVELLPTTPSFLTLLLMSGLYQQFRLSSLRIITYGTEVMPDSTLAGLRRVLPDVTLKQTYGLSELGILSTQSRDSASRWMKIGGEGVSLQVKDDTLWVKSEQAMLGYLNAPSPFDEEGWYNTQDKVEVDGEYFRILGRESEVINVAGEKVFPGEVESFLLTLDNVKDVVVKGKRSPVVGQMVWAEFLLERDEAPSAFKQRVLAACRRHLAPFKIPGMITIATSDTLMGSRFKKIRQTYP